MSVTPKPCVSVVYGATQPAGSATWIVYGVPVALACWNLPAGMIASSSAGVTSSVELATCTAAPPACGTNETAGGPS